MTQHLLLSALLHHDGDPRDEVSRLLPNPRRRRVEPPPNNTGDLRQVGLHSGAERIDDSAEAIEHDCGVVRRLLLERVDDAIDDLLLEPRVNVRDTEVCDRLVDRLHNHLPVGLRSILEILDDAANDVGAPYLVGDLHSRVYQLPVVAPVQGHAHDPEVSEERRQDVLSDVIGLDALCGDALLHDLEDDLLHLLVRSGELSDEDDHHLSRVVVSMLGVH
mmetsp:Transcript_26212/g.75629  ORF Transcript_26212/g.75629 Transcript_26212/m.75629 type:complete len:219 (-) Transcript_26212:2063-2719(-)